MRNNRISNILASRGMPTILMAVTTLAAAMPWLASAGTLGTVGNVASGAQLANTAANIAAGETGSGIAAVSHATSWQHVAGLRIGQARQLATNGRMMGPVQANWSAVGKFAGRAAVVTAVWEGFWDVGTMIRCGCGM